MQPDFPLRRKNPNGPLKVILIGRISTEHQNLESIEASFRYAENFLLRLYHGPVEFKQLGERASGMLADRATIRTAEDLIATGTWDLVLAEDLSRVYRNPRHQFNFVQDCVDAETRVICIADNLDTASDNWEVMLGAAALRHGTMIPDTRRRVRRSATHAFHNGGMVLRVKFGYRRLSKEDAASGLHGPKGLRIAKRPECTPIIRKMAERVIDGASFEAVAEWLVVERVEPPPYAQRWSARLVRNLLSDPLLCGTRTFRKVIHKPIYRTGKYRRIPNVEPEVAVWPELSHLTPEEHHRVLTVICERQRSRTTKRGAEHPLYGSPRSRSLWPGQHLRCGVCDGLLYSAGGYLKCRNALKVGKGTCWNRVQVRVSEAREKIIDWLRKTFCSNTAFSEAVACAARHELQRQVSLSNAAAVELANEITALERQATNLSQAIAAGGQLPPLLEKLSEVNSALVDARRRSKVAAKEEKTRIELPGKQGIIARLPELLRRVVDSQYEFNALLRQVLGDCRVHPVQALDTPLVRPRLRFEIRLSGALATSKLEDVGTGAIRRTVEMDLFCPPLHIEHLKACIEQRQRCPDQTYREIGLAVGVGVMTVKRAFDYSNRMQRANEAAPYRELSEQPAKASRWRC